MIDNILVISSEHQPYRRAAQIAACELGKYPIDRLKIIWANHRHHHSENELIEMIAEHGLENYREVLNINTPEWDFRHYYLSIFEANVRTFRTCVDTNTYAIILQDDFLLKIPYEDIAEKIEQLLNVVGEQVFLQLDYSYDSYQHEWENRDDSIRPVKGTLDFVHGCLGASEHALYVTPQGAARMLHYLSTTEHMESVESHLPRHLYNADWVYSALRPETFVHHASALQGDSIGVWHNKQNFLPNREPQGAEAKQMGIIEKYKLLPDTAITEIRQHGQEDSDTDEVAE